MQHFRLSESGDGINNRRSSHVEVRSRRTEELEFADSHQQAIRIYIVEIDGDVGVRFLRQIFLLVSFTGDHLLFWGMSF